MKKNVAIIWGGYSSEVIVSEKSMKGIYSFLDKNKYNVYKVKIVKDGWSVNVDEEIYPIDKNDFSFFDKKENKKITFSIAYITIHGTPGEDGRLQGYFDMLDIPYSSCGVLTSSLTFDKFTCNNYLKNFDITVADSMYLADGQSFDENLIVEKLGLPMFVKPNTGGSSFATTKVKAKEEIKGAIEYAFKESKEVIIESFIKGTEVTCGCYKIGEEKTVLPLTEVVTKNEFFDYKAKYEGQVEEITPARISDAMTEQIQKLTLKIYDLVGAKGLIRVDFIISDNVPFLLEVNTTPGMTLTSFIPQQLAAAELNITEVFTQMIENELKRNS